MDSREKSSTIPIDKKELKYEDLLQSLNVFSSEYNNSSFHDRVLVFQIDNYIIKEDGEDRLLAENSSITSMASEDGCDIEQDKEEDIEEEDVSAREQEVEEVEHINAEPEVKDVYAEQVKLKGVTPGSLNDEEPEKVENNGSIKIVVPGEIKPDKQLKDHKIFVHSCWLSVQSPYFKSLFYSGMKESHSKELKEVAMKIPQSELEAHVTLIEAMYKTDILNNKDYKLVVQVMVLADKYVVELVFKKCKYVLMDTPMTLESCQCILENINNLPNCDDLLDYLKTFLVKTFSPLDKTWTEDRFIELSEVLLKLLLSSDNLAVQSENTVFVALMKWIELNNISPNSSWLLNLVRFEFMSVDFLCDVVENHSIAEEMLGFNQCLREGYAYHCFSEERRQLMEDRPVQRPIFHAKHDTPVFVWVIDKNIRNKLLMDTSVHSCDFWCNGYQMVIRLVHDPHPPQPSQLSGLFTPNPPQTGLFTPPNLPQTSQSGFTFGQQSTSQSGFIFGSPKQSTIGLNYVNDFSIYLEVKNVTIGAYFNLTWRIESNLFTTYIMNDHKMSWSTGLSLIGFEKHRSNVDLASVAEDRSHTIKVFVIGWP